MKQLGNLAGLAFGLAMVAVIAAKPAFIGTTFTGASGLIRSAVSPVTGK